MKPIALWGCAALAASVLSTCPVAAQASTGTDSVVWTSSQAPPIDRCTDTPSYTRPGRYSLRYACGRWYLHKPARSNYADLMLVGLLIVGVVLKFARRSAQ